MEQEKKPKHEVRKKESEDEADHGCTDSEDNESLEFAESYGMDMLYEQVNRGTTREEFQTYTHAMRNGQMSGANVPVFMRMPEGSSEVTIWTAEDERTEILNSLQAHLQKYGLSMNMPEEMQHRAAMINKPRRHRQEETARFAERGTDSPSGMMLEATGETSVGGKVGTVD